ncbi:prepilin-type N-terminal cleavage/methylation domain-containing protein [Sulfurimonas sp. HSL-1656]|uniref:prepilin-type N-terminal cleavage/methylation domain-containing protein n=1 Tax=Thiomicrolovo subterrani TaxID=3131934 RepID=UPI0031F7F1E3
MPSASSSRRGFTLFELLLVVLLIAVLYGVFINKLSTGKGPADGKDTVTLETLRDYLSRFRPQRGDVTLVCPEPCETCSVFIDGKAVEGADISLFKQEPTVYRRDRYGQFEPYVFLPVRRGETDTVNVCFAFTLRDNDSSSSYIVESGELYYLFEAFGEPVRRFETLDEAAEAYSRKALIPDDKRVYDF